MNLYKQQVLTVAVKIQIKKHRGIDGQWSLRFIESVWDGGITMWFFNYVLTISLPKKDAMFYKPGPIQHKRNCAWRWKSVPNTKLGIMWSVKHFLIILVCLSSASCLCKCEFSGYLLCALSYSNNWLQRLLSVFCVQIYIYLVAQSCGAEFY